MYNHDISFKNNQISFDYLFSIITRFGIQLSQSFVKIDIPFTSTPARIKLLNYIIFKIVVYKQARPTYAYMQKECGLTRKAIYNAIQDFEKCGLINVLDRHLSHEANVYSLGPVFMNATVCMLLQSIFPRLNLARIRTMQRSGNKAYTTTIPLDYTPLSLNRDVCVSNTSSVIVYYNKKIYSAKEKAEFLLSTIGKAWKNMVTWIANDPSVSKSNFDKKTYEYKLQEKDKKNLKVVNTTPKIAIPVVVPYSHKAVEQTAIHNQWQSIFAAFIPVDKKVM